VKPTALYLLVEQHPVRTAGIVLYAILALGYSLLQWRYAASFRRRSSRRGELDRRFQVRGGAPGRAPSVDVIVPCYNEDPRLLGACCAALEAQRSDYPGRVNVWLVDDGSPAIADLEPVYQKFAALTAWQVVRHPSNLGKRHAQDSVFRRGDGRYVVTVDSDTVLGAGSLVRLVAAMEQDDHIGAVSGYVRARNAATNRLTALIDRRYAFLFRQERSAQSWHRAVTCCTGPLSIYRRSVLAKVWERYVEDRFRGRPRNFGDDVWLTELVLEQGYDSLYEPSARAWTNVPETLGGYVRQQTRWNKSFYRELPRAVRALRRHRAARPELPGAHRYVHFELAARVVLPLLTPGLVGTNVLAALVGEAGDRWRLLLPMVVALLVHALVVGLQSRSVTFPLGYGLLYLTVLPLVRLRALRTLTDSRWGTRERRQPERGRPARVTALLTAATGTGLLRRLRGLRRSSAPVF
jgi:glycosyltransferase involved in cell wall biosynthesis